MYYRRNVDKTLRDLERRAATGDLEAIRYLRVARKRAQQRREGRQLAFNWMEGHRRIDLENCMNTGPDASSVPILADNGRVFWSKNYNSYIMVYPPAGESGQFWHETEGQVNLYSINGNGEVRWDVSASDADEDPYSTYGGEGAAVAFGLVDSPRDNPGKHPGEVVFENLVRKYRNEGWDDLSIARQIVDDLYRRTGEDFHLHQHKIEWKASQVK